MAGGTILQVDQAAPAHQVVLWHIRERGQDANLDRRLDLRARRYHQKTTQHQAQSLFNPTDFEPDPF